MNPLAAASLALALVLTFNAAIAAALIAHFIHENRSHA